MSRSASSSKIKMKDEETGIRKYRARRLYTLRKEFCGHRALVILLAHTVLRTGFTVSR